MHTGDNIMKMLDLINEAETDKEKNLRHTKDLDSLEREIRKSKDGLDKDTQAHIDKKRKELAANKAKMKETTSAGSVASVATPVGGMISRQMKNADGTAKNALDVDTNIMGHKKKKKKNKR
jgi:hypothetical protein